MLQNEVNSKTISYKRKITPFVLDNMVVDYCMQRLDQTSHVEIEKRIVSDLNLKKKCAEIESALEFCDSLGKLRITQQSVGELSEDLGLQKIIAYYKKIRPQLILAVSLVGSFILSLLIYKLIKMFLLNE